MHKSARDCVHCVPCKSEVFIVTHCIHDTLHMCTFWVIQILFKSPEILLGTISNQEYGMDIEIFSLLATMNFGALNSFLDFPSELHRPLYQ